MLHTPVGSFGTLEEFGFATWHRVSRFLLDLTQLVLPHRLRSLSTTASTFHFAQGPMYVSRWNIRFPVVLA